MPPNPWFRMYTEAVDDEKLRLLAFEDRWHFVAILCCKGKGVLDTGNIPMMRRMVAVKLGLDLRELDEVARRLSDVGLVDPETLQPLAWDHRQFQSDKSTDRVRAYRERARNKGETLRKRSETVSVTAQDTDTDTETETEKVKGLAKAAARFRPPTIDEVDAYCRERKNSVNPQRFVDHYTANGWVQGKGKPLKDWRAAVRTWERDEQGGGQQATIQIPDGDDMATRAVLWTLCQEAGVTADEVRGKSTDAIRKLIRSRHPGAGAVDKGSLRVIKGGAT